MDTCAARVKAFDCDPIDDVLTRATSALRPAVVVARTIKGKGISFLENREGWHGKAFDSELAGQALVEIGAIASRTFSTLKPKPWRQRQSPVPREPRWKTYSGRSTQRQRPGGSVLHLWRGSSPDLIA